MCLLKVLICSAAFISITAASAWPKSPGQGALDRGVQFYKAKKFEKALDAYKQATELDPGLLKAWENLAVTNRKLKRDDEALRIWDILLKIDPQNVGLLNEMGSIYMTRKAWDLAILRFTESIQIKPDQHSIRLRLGDAFEALGARDKAMLQYQTILRFHPESLTATLRIISLYEKEGKEDEAIKFLDGQLARVTRPLILRRHMARLIARQGDRAFQHEEFPIAEARYKAAMKWDPANPGYAVNLGWTQRKQGQTWKAIDTWQEALALDPKQGHLYRHLADAYREGGEYQEASRWYERAQESEPHEPAIPYSLTEIALRENKIDEAVIRLAQTLALSKGNESWYQRAVSLFINYNQTGRGVTFFEGRLHINTEVDLTKKALSRLYAAQSSIAYQGGEFEKAARRYREALQMDPQNLQALRDLGWSYWYMEQGDQCETVWKDYAERYPDRV